MELDVVERAKQSIQEYLQRNSVIGGIKGYQGIQYVIGQTSSTTMSSIFVDRRDQIYHLRNKEGFNSLYQALLMCEMVDPYISKSARVVCAAVIIKK